MWVLTWGQVPPCRQKLICYKHQMKETNKQKPRQLFECYGESAPILGEKSCGWGKKSLVAQALVSRNPIRTSLTVWWTCAAYHIVWQLCPAYHTVWWLCTTYHTQYGDRALPVTQCGERVLLIILSPALSRRPGMKSTPNKCLWNRRILKV